jgi:hypothetical protein
VFKEVIGEILNPKARTLKLNPAQTGVSKEVIMSILLNLSPSIRAVIDHSVPDISMYVPNYLEVDHFILVVDSPCTVGIAKDQRYQRRMGIKKIGVTRRT